MGSCVHIASLVSIHQIIAEMWILFLFGSFATEFDWLWWINTFANWKANKLHFVRLGPQIICDKFVEDWTKLVACDIFFNHPIKCNIVAASVRLMWQLARSWPWDHPGYHQNENYFLRQTLQITSQKVFLLIVTPSSGQMMKGKWVCWK